MKDNIQKFIAGWCKGSTLGSAPKNLRSIRRPASIVFVIFFLIVNIQIFAPVAHATEAVPLYIKWNFSNSQSSGYLENPINRSVTDALPHTQAFSFWKMQGMRFYNYQQPCDIYIEFDVAAISATDPFTSGGTQAYNLYGLNIDGTKGLNISNAAEGTSAFITYLAPNGYITSYPEFNNMYPVPAGRTILIHIHSDGNETQNVIDLDFVNVPLFFTTLYNSQRVPIIPYISNIRVFNDLSSLLIANIDELEDIADALDIVKSVNQQTLGYVHNIRDSVAGLYSIEYSLYNPNWNYTTFEYDSNGDLTTSSSSGSWYQALLATLQNISGDAQRQAEEQQRSKEAGADDALDLAYDSVGSSFGALGDFAGLGSLGTFDGDSFGSAAEGGLLSWFSSECQQSIDAVPRIRAPADIVDFYSAHIEEYLQGVNNVDSTDYSGD